MNWLSRSLKTNDFTYSSLQWNDSKTHPGVSYSTRRVSLSQRLDLLQRLKELTHRHEFLSAGGLEEQTEATITELLAKKLYLEWGLDELKGLKIDGLQATGSQLVENGPESLCDEIVDAIRSSIELTDSERKNS